METRFIITHNCNYSCWFCHREGWKSQFNGYADIEKFKKVVVTLKKFGMDKTTISGGEPLLHPYFEEIIDFLYDQKIKVSLVTNGSLIDRKLHSLKKVDLINLSIHTLDNLIYLKNSCGRVSLNEALNNAHRLQEYYPQKEIRINVIADKYLFNNFEKCLEQLTSFKSVKLIELFPYQDELSITIIKDLLEQNGYRLEEVRQNRRKIIYRKDDNRIFLTKVLCSEVNFNHLNKDFCVKNNEINISPEFKVKKCRFVDGENILPYIDNDDISNFIEKIINMTEVSCEYS